MKLAKEITEGLKQALCPDYGDWVFHDGEDEASPHEVHEVEAVGDDEHKFQVDFLTDQEDEEETISYEIVVRRVPSKEVA